MALYLGRLAADGKSLATISQARATISHFHAAGMRKDDNPARHPVVAEAMKGWHNQAAAPKQADALTAEALARVREVLRLPKRGRGGRMESANTARRPRPGHHRGAGRRRAEALRGRRPDLGRRGAVGRPHRTHHGSERQEPGRTGHGSGQR